MKQIYATVCLAGLVAGCATNRPLEMGATSGSPQTASGSAQSVPAIDETFARTVCQVSAAEIEFGKLALKNSRNAEVRKFARALANEHTDNTRELIRLLARKGIQADMGLTCEFQTSLEKLAALDGQEFDRAFKEHVIRHHEAAVELLEKYRSEGSDSDLKRFAEWTLPQICEELTAARALVVPENRRQPLFTGPTTPSQSH